jgi:23S rRNA (pseudouridine1915-N3)-methyltransferase
MPRGLQVILQEIRPGRRDSDSAAAVSRVQTLEKARILAAIPADSVKVALDERGEPLTTARFAKQLELWMSGGRDVSFLIGGADGLDDELKRDADMMISLSPLTLPHALVRVVLAEQLYRAASLIRNHPYHRE